MSWVDLDVIGVFGFQSGSEVRLLSAEPGDVQRQERRRRRRRREWGETGGVGDPEGPSFGCSHCGDQEREQDRGFLFEEPLCEADRALLSWQCCRFGAAL